MVIEQLLTPSAASAHHGIATPHDRPDLAHSGEAGRAVQLLLHIPHMMPCIPQGLLSWVSDLSSSCYSATGQGSHLLLHPSHDALHAWIAGQQQVATSKYPCSCSLVCLPARVGASWHRGIGCRRHGGHHLGYTDRVLTWLVSHGQHRRGHQIWVLRLLCHGRHEPAVCLRAKERANQ
eukprot:200745-Pelagomonas_calceolata.AAC.1